MLTEFAPGSNVAPFGLTRTMLLHNVHRTFVIFCLIGTVVGQFDIEENNIPGELPINEKRQGDSPGQPETDADVAQIYRPWLFEHEEVQEPQSAWAASRSLQAVRRRTPAAMRTSSLQTASIRNPSLDAPVATPPPPSVPAGTRVTGRYLVFFKEAVTDIDAGIRTYVLQQQEVPATAAH